MALYLTKEPEVISFSKDPIIYEFMTDNMVVSAGTAAVNKITFTGGVAADDVIVISWGSVELRMIAKAVPVLSNEFLAGTSDLNVLLPYFRDNYTIEKDFVVSIVAGKIDLTARAAGTKYNIAEVSFEGGTITTTVAGVDAIIRKNFGVYFEIWVQKEDGTDAVRKIHDDVIPVDRITSKVDLDISQILHSELKEDFPWEITGNAGICKKSKRKYYLRYAEVFGERQQVQRLTLSATKHVLMGGSSLISRKSVLELLQGANAAADACLRIGDVTRYILQLEDQYLFFLAARANVGAKLQAIITYSDASTETKYSSIISANTYEKVYFKSSLSVFEPNVSKTVVQYVVRVVDSNNANAEISKQYTYIIDYSIRRSVRNFYYLNSLGAVDEFATFGKGSREIEYYKDSVEKAVTDLGIEAQEEDYNIEGREFYEAATGFRSKRELAYMRDFFLSSRKYVKNLGKWLPIILANKRVKEAEDSKNLAGYKFEYSLAYRDDSLSDNDLSDIIGYPLPPQGFLGGGNITISVSEPNGIVIDAMPTLGSANAVSSNGVAVSLATKQDIIALGTELQYIRGDGTLGTLGDEISELGGNVFENKWNVKNTLPVLALGYGSGNVNIGNFENDSLTKILGRFAIQNSNGFLAQFSVANITADRVITAPDRNIEINKWSDLSGVPNTFTPSVHTHQIGDITGLTAALNNKQDLNPILTALTGLSGNGIVRKTGATTFSIGTNEPITLSGDVNGTGTTSIAVTLVNSGVVAGTYRSVTVDAKGRVTAGTNPTTFAGYGILRSEFNSYFDFYWNNTIKDEPVEFGSDVTVNGALGVFNNFFVGGQVFDKEQNIGTANQVLMPVSGGVAWTSLSTAQISNFSANVLGQVLTGLGAGSNTPITAANTVLSAFQNLQAQITNKTTAERLVFGEGYFQNSSSGMGFVYKPSVNNSFLQGNTNKFTGEFDLSKISQNRKWEMPNYDGTLTTYEKVTNDFWKIGGNVGISEDAVFDINSKITYIGFDGIQDPPYNYLWKINGQTKMQLTPAGNFSVGGIAPEAVIHAHANIVGNAEVVALKASNNVSSAYFSIGIDSTNNRTNFYSGGEVWATTISKFKFGSADISGLWNFSVVPQSDSDATTGNQLVRFSQVQSMVSAGFRVKQPVKLVVFASIMPSGNVSNGGYTTSDNDRVLLIHTNDATKSGIYKILAGSAWTRDALDDEDAEMRGGGYLCLYGNYANTQFVNTNATTITIGTTEITYAQWSGVETDPVWSAFKTANDITNTRIGNWNDAYTNRFTNAKAISATLAGYTSLIYSAITTSDSISQAIGKLEGRFIGFWSKLGTQSNGVGTTNSDTFDFYQNNVKRMQLSGNSLTGLNSLNVNSGTFTIPYATSFPTYYGITNNNNAQIGYLGGTAKAIYSLDLIRGGNTGNRSGIRFGNYNSGGQINNFEFGIEYSTNNTLQIGKYNSTQMDGANTALVSENSVFIKPNGFWGFGFETPAERIDVNGNINLIGVIKNSNVAPTANQILAAVDEDTMLWRGLIADDIPQLTTSKITGLDDAINARQAQISVAENYLLKYTAADGVIASIISSEAGVAVVHGSLSVTDNILLNGVQGTDHYFIKSNGSTTVWSPITVGEIADISTYYATKQDAVLYGNYEGERGFKLFHNAEKTDTAALFFANADTGTVGIHYYGLDNNNALTQHGINISGDGFVYHRKLNGQRVRFLTTDDSLTGGSGVWTGGTVSTELNLQFSKQQKFLANNGSVIHRKYSSNTGENIFVESTEGQHTISATQSLYLTGGVVGVGVTGGYVHIDNVAFDMSGVPSLVNQNARFYITSLGSGRWKAKIVAA